MYFWREWRVSPNKKTAISCRPISDSHIALESVTYMWLNKEASNHVNHVNKKSNLTLTYWVKLQTFSHKCKWKTRLEILSRPKVPLATPELVIGSSPASPELLNNYSKSILMHSFAQIKELKALPWVGHLQKQTEYHSVQPRPEP